MRWRIRGQYAPSGEWKSAIVDAPTKGEAEALGAAGGLTQITAEVEVSQWIRAATPLFLIAMFGLGLFQTYRHGNRDSARELGALTGAYVFGAAVLAALIAPIASYVRKLGYEVGWILYACAFVGIGKFTAHSSAEAGARIGALILPLLITEGLLVLLNWRRPHMGKLLAAVGVVILLVVIGLSQVRWKSPTPKAARAQDILSDLSDLKKTGTRLPEVRQGTKDSGLAPFINLTGRMMDRMAAQTAAYQKKGSEEHVERILQAANLLDPAERASSRASIARLETLRAEHEKAVLAMMDDYLKETAQLDIEPQRRANLLQGAKASYSKMAAFIHSQLALDGEALDEFLNVLDLMDRAKGATVSNGRFMFATQRDVDDHHRATERMNRLILLRQRRAEELQQHLPQMHEYSQDELGANLELKRIGTWDPAPRSGARVILDGQGITVDGKVIRLAIEKSELIGLLGQPREVAGAEIVYCVWDELGIGVVHKRGVTRITNMMVALNPRKTDQWPKHLVRGGLTMMGVAVDENSTPWSLNRKLKTGRFVATDQEGKEWELVLERYKVMTTFKVDGSIDMLYVSHLGRLAEKAN